jgi:hypothetical protein
MPKKVSFETVDAEKMDKILSESRSGRGGRRSKYTPIKEAVDALEGDKALHLKLSKSEVQGVRQYLRKHFGKQVKVVSSAVKGSTDQYHVFVKPDEEAGE